MKKILIFAAAALFLAISVWSIKDRSDLQEDYSLIRTDWAISRARSWRMRLETTDQKSPKEWMVIEAIPPDREHGWQHVDRALDGDTRIKGDLEYIRIKDDRYFRGDAMFGHRASAQWIKLIPTDFPPLDGFYEYRLHMSNPRTIGYSFDSIRTSFWANYHGVNMQPDSPRTYAGHVCLERSYNWTIEDTGQVMHDTVCTGKSDHLPYHLSISGNWAEISYEWNPRVAIDPPNPISERPKDFRALPSL